MFKKDLLQVTIPVVGETSSYNVTIKMDGVVAEIAKNIKINGTIAEIIYMCAIRSIIFLTSSIESPATT